MKKLLFVLLLIPFFVTGCGNYSELNDLAIATGFSVDIEDDEYKVSLLIANAKKSQSSAKEGEAQTTVYSGTGKTITDALKEVDKKSPKTMYLGHLSVVIISEDVAKKGIFEMADYLMRAAESRKKFYFVIARDSDAKDVLSIVIPLESFPSHGIATLIETTNQAQAITTIVPYSKFIANVLVEGKNPVLPSIEIIGDADKGKSAKALEETNIKSYLKVSSMALFDEDKLVDFATTDESQMINLLSNSSDSLLTSFKEDGAEIGFNLSNLKTKTKLIDKDHVEIKVTGKADIREVNDKRNLENQKVIAHMEELLNKNITSRINDTIDSLKYKYKTDVLALGNMVYKKYPKVWEEESKYWDEKYFKKLSIKVSTDIKIVSTGSLKQSLKEVK